MLIQILIIVIGALTVALGVTLYHWRQDSIRYTDSLKFWQKQALHLEARLDLENERLRSIQTLLEEIT